MNRKYFLILLIPFFFAGCSFTSTISDNVDKEEPISGLVSYREINKPSVEYQLYQEDFASSKKIKIIDSKIIKYSDSLPKEITLYNKKVKVVSVNSELEQGGMIRFTIELESDGKKGEIVLTFLKRISNPFRNLKSFGYDFNLGNTGAFYAGMEFGDYRLAHYLVIPEIDFDIENNLWNYFELGMLVQQHQLLRATDS